MEAKLGKGEKKMTIKKWSKEAIFVLSNHGWGVCGKKNMEVILPPLYKTKKDAAGALIIMFKATYSEVFKMEATQLFT